MLKVKSLLDKAKKLKKTIVYPEAEYSDRTIKAVEILLKKKIVNVILLGNPEKILKKSNKLKNAVIIDPTSSELLPEMVEALVEIRKNKGMTSEEATKLLENNIYFACMLVKLGYADGYIAGAETSTADTLRPALQIIKTKPNIDIVSSCFMMVGTKKLGYGENNVIFTSDCALNISPNAKEIKDIVLSTAKTAKSFCNITPKVALLSFSSFGSGGDSDADILKMREALQLIKKEDKTLLVDGEMQLDCAISKTVAKLKSKNSKVAGQANILIFPNLCAGNIGYKLMERFGKLQAVGVIMQGFDKPVNDMSRGCKIDDIVVMSAITALQADMD